LTNSNKFVNLSKH